MIQPRRGFLHQGTPKTKHPEQRSPFSAKVRWDKNCKRPQELLSKASTFSHQLVTCCWTIRKVARPQPQLMHHSARATTDHRPRQMPPTPANGILWGEPATLLLSATSLHIASCCSMMIKDNKAVCIHTPHGTESPDAPSISCFDPRPMRLASPKIQITASVPHLTGNVGGRLVLVRRGGWRWGGKLERHRVALFHHVLEFVWRERVPIAFRTATASSSTPTNHSRSYSWG